MELVANVWPVVDSATHMIVRFMMRAYAMTGSDAVMRSTLRALAATDYCLAKTYRIPDRFTVVSEHGSITGCVTGPGFHQHQGVLLEPAFRDLEGTYNQLQGVATEPEGQSPIGVAQIPRFPSEPFLVVTMLLELPDGRLVPQVS